LLTNVFKATVGPVFVVYFWLHVSHGDRSLPILLCDGFGIGYVAMWFDAAVGIVSVWRTM